MGGNTVLAAEALIVLDLVDAVLHTMKGAEEGKIAMHVDCRIIITAQIKIK